MRCDFGTGRASGLHLTLGRGFELAFNERIHLSTILLVDESFTRALARIGFSLEVNGSTAAEREESEVSRMCLGPFGDAGLCGFFCRQPI